MTTVRCGEAVMREAQFARTDETVGSAARRMRDADVGFLPVCDLAGKVVGAITDRDLAIRVLAEDGSPLIPVATVMTPEVVACRPEEDLRRAEELMEAHGMSRIMCIDADGRLVSVISRSDLARLERDDRAAGHVRGVIARGAAIPSAIGEPPVDASSEGAFREIEASGALPSHLTAPVAAGVVLCTLTRRLNAPAAFAFAAALPSALGRILGPCAVVRDEDPEIFGRDQLIATVAEELQMARREAEALARAVLRAVRARVSDEERSAVDAQLPPDLRELWRPRRAA